MYQVSYLVKRPLPPTTRRSEGHKMYKVLKFIVDPFRLNSVLPEEGSILDPCFETWE